MDFKHILICGERGAGKSTLIKRLLADCKCPVRGYITKAGSRRSDGYRSFYIHAANSGDMICDENNCVGSSNSHSASPCPKVFDDVGVALLDARPGEIIVMDELGFMESGSSKFCRAVLDCLDGDIPVIAAVKAKYHVEFLNQVRSHPKAACYDINAENREALYLKLKPVIKQINAHCRDGA